jgi:hypothetical protein
MSTCSANSDKVKKIIESKNKTIQILQAELAIYKKMSESATTCIEEIAKQPKITNISNKWINVMPFNLLNDEKAQEKLIGMFENHYGEDHFFQGQAGIARLAHKHLLKDVNGYTIYKCTDSRDSFKYKNNNGDICKDVKAKQLAQLLGDSVKPFAKSMLGDLSDCANSDELLVVITNFHEINNMEKDSGKFRAELRCLTSK